MLKVAYKYDEIYIYGARIVAGTVYYFLTKKLPEIKINGFVVTAKENDSFLEKPVYEIAEIKNKNSLIIVATIECFHAEIAKKLNELNFKNIIFIDDLARDSMVLELNSDISYIKSTENISHNEKKLNIFMATGHFDKISVDVNSFDKWVVPIQVGSSFTDNILYEIRDNTGDNISDKNKNYCELTATYWIWKNIKNDYIGLCHYRRHFRLNEKMINYIFDNDIDVVLPVPVICLPNARQHHSYYIDENAFSTMMDVLREYYPEYYNEADKVFNEKLFYWHNMWIMKKEHLDKYCTWLFDILEKVERKVDINNIRSDRYLGYLAESLTTLYFRCNKYNLKIEHVSERMII